MHKGDHMMEEINKYRRVNPSHVLRTLVGLMENPHSTDKVERQLFLINDFVTNSCYGFWLQDLFCVMKLIELTMQKVESEPRFEPHLRQLLNLCSMAPYLMRSNDILYCEPHIIQYFSFFGFIMVTAKSMTHKYLMVKSLSRIVNRKKNNERTLPVEVCNRMIEKSNLVQTMSNALEVYHDDFYTNLLQLTCTIAKISDKICHTMLKENLLTIVLTKIDPDWMENKGGRLPGHDNLDLQRAVNLQHSLNLISVLLTALSNAPECFKAEVAQPDVEALWGFRYALRVFVFNNKRMDRNFLFSLLLNFMELFPNALFLQSGIVKDVCILAIGSEMGTVGTWAALVHFGYDKVEYYYKRMLVIAVYYCSKMFGAYLEINDLEVVEALMKYITEYEVFNWSIYYLCSLRRTVLAIFERMIPDYVDAFLDAKIMERLTDLLISNNKKPIVMDVLILAIRCLHRVLSVRSDPRMLELCNKCETFKVLQDTAKNILNTDIFNSNNQRALLYIFSVLTLLIKTIKAKNFDSIYMSEKLLRRMLKMKATDIRPDPWLLVTILNYIWELGIRNNELFLLFIDAQGVHLILDIIKEGPFPVKTIGLGLAVDLCEEPSAIPFFTTWRKDGTNLVQMCLATFREENEMTGVPCDARGVIEELDSPLMGTYQRELGKSSQRDMNQSLSVTNLLGSCRPKIYALLQLLEVRHQYKTDAANEYYKIYNCDLSIDDRITKLLCDNFMAFKLGESWNEVRNYMETLNFALVPMDQYLIDSTTSCYNMLAKNVQEMQLELLEFERRNDRCTEEEFYNLLRESKLGDALKALQEIQYIARTTESLFRYSKKMTDSMKFIELPMMHQTFDHSLGVNSIKNQRMQIQSDIIIDNTLEKEPVLVSPISSSLSIPDIPEIDVSGFDFEIEMKCKDSNSISLDNYKEKEKKKRTED